MSELTIRIDDQPVSCQPGDTIMCAAERAGIYIPHLCHHPDLPAYGSCKLCTVRVNGRAVSACTQVASDGDQVENDTPELGRMRRHLIQLLFVEGNHYCPSCERSGNCQLQATAYALDMEESFFEQRFPRRQLDGSHADILLDRDRCIHCGLCVRASVTDGKQLFSIGGRGGEAYLAVNSSTGLLGDTDLEPTDLAANICPVGALLRRGEGFSTPIGQRLYDQQTICDIGNQRPPVTETEEQP